jgi:hypothetical protein
VRPAWASSIQIRWGHRLSWTLTRRSWYSSVEESCRSPYGSMESKHHWPWEEAFEFECPHFSYQLMPVKLMVWIGWIIVAQCGIRTSFRAEIVSLGVWMFLNCLCRSSIMIAWGVFLSYARQLCCPISYYKGFQELSLFWIFWTLFIISPFICHSFAPCIS